MAASKLECLNWNPVFVIFSLETFKLSVKIEDISPRKMLKIVLGTRGRKNGFFIFLLTVYMNSLFEMYPLLAL